MAKVYQEAPLMSNTALRQSSSKPRRLVSFPTLCVSLTLWACTAVIPAHSFQNAKTLLQLTGTYSGIGVLTGTPTPNLIVELCRTSQLVWFVQLNNRTSAQAMRVEMDRAGLLGTRVYVEHGSPEHLPLADNFVDNLFVIGTQGEVAPPVRREILRILHPGAKAVIGSKIITKARPPGADDWSHPYHGPDNNPQSTDQNAKAPYLTQFLAEPWYVPMPQVTVASGGRIFKAFGHIALKRREWPWLNKLVAINAYNGTHLWQRDLTPGFMIHRSTLIATPQTVFLADNTGCKLIDANTGELRSEIKIPANVDPDGVWKWLALKDGILYGLVGPQEPIDEVIRGDRKPAGWPWSGLGKQYGGNYAWGFGRTLLAMNPQTGKILWHRQWSKPIDSRALCLAAGRIFVYSNQAFLTCLDAMTGTQLWHTEEPSLLDAIGTADRAQTASKGFASSAYAKANDIGLFIAGPQRKRLVAIDATTGNLMWQYPHGNLQLVLREDGLYAMGRTETSKVFAYRTGEVLADLECYRGNCTRATGTVDSIFTRGYRHTGTMRLDLAGNYPRRIPLMRPACQDGVIVAEGLLYWGPWMCDCNHSLIGMISLAPAGDFFFSAEASQTDRLETSPTATTQPAVELTAADWPQYRANAERTGASAASVATTVRRRWLHNSRSDVEPTAPIVAGNTVYWSSRDGSVRAVNLANGKEKWTGYTGGAVRFPPEFHLGNIYVGSGDGYVYCFDSPSGKQIWRFQAAPGQRRIAVHGELLSTWPVGSGVLARQGVVYAAAGITSYDGTHVYALDAATGKIRWQNNASGHLVDDQQVTGISVQGHLLWHANRLYLAGGNVVSPAIYDPRTGKCLNELTNEWWNRPDGATEVFPSRPKKDMFQRAPRGRELFVVDNEVRVFDQLLYAPPKNGPSRYFGGHFLQVSSTDMVIRATNNRLVRLATEKTKDGKPIGVWQNTTLRDPRALAICRNAVVAAGEMGRVNPQEEDGETKPTHAVLALDPSDGKPIWSQPLPAAPAPWGLAISRNGDVIITLVDGRVVCFGS